MALTKEEFKDTWRNPNVTKIGHNLQYEIIWLTPEYGAPKGPLFDTMIAPFLLNEHTEDQSLKALAYRYRQAPPWEDKWEPYKKELKQLEYLPQPFIKPLLEYNEEDIGWTRELHKPLSLLLKQNGLETLFKVEMENLKTLARMTSWGVRIDHEQLNTFSEQYQTELARLESRFDFNPRSNPQKLRALREAGYNLSSTGVEHLAQLTGELPANLTRYSKLQKMLSTYLGKLESHIYPDGRIHPRFNQTRTVSGRLSSSDPNGQNFPRDTEELPFRRLFRGTWDRVLSADFSQMELRVAAFLSRDAKLLAVYQSGGDIHSATGESIWGKPASRITENERVVSKVTNFTCLYDPFDSAVPALVLQCRANGIDLAWDKGRRIVETFRSTYPGWFMGFVPACMRKVYDQGWVRSKAGRICRIPCQFKERTYEEAIANPDNWETFRSLINAMDQGLATGDLTKFVQTCIDKEFQRRDFKSHIMLNNHDEIDIDVYPEEEEEVIEIVTRYAEHPPTRPIFGWDITDVVPLVVDIGLGETWSDAKKKENKLKRRPDGR